MNENSEYHKQELKRLARVMDSINESLQKYLDQLKGREFKEEVDLVVDIDELDDLLDRMKKHLIWIKNKK